MKECESCQRCFADEVDVCPVDGEPTLATLHGPPRIDRYELQRRLGEGGMGVVFKARHEYLNTLHALKIILPGSLALDPKLVQRFRQEARAVAAIRHPNVVAVTDSGVAGGTTPFLVMEFLEGRALEDLLAGGTPLPPARALEIIAAAGSGVGAAHRLGIVHRDLKPQNIFITDGDTPAHAVKVLDFGLAKVIVEGLLGSLKVEESSGIVGTPLYLAPEQWLRERPDERTDVYALGLILYRMLAGRLPFFGATPGELMHLHLAEQPPPLSSFGVRVPPRLEGALRHALAKDRAQRPPSVEAFLRELSAAHDFGGGSGSEAARPAPDPPLEQAATLRDVPLAPTLRTEPPAAEVVRGEVSKAAPKRRAVQLAPARLLSTLRTKRAFGVLLLSLAAGLAFALLVYAGVFKFGADGGPRRAPDTPAVEAKWRVKHVLGKHAASVDAVTFTRAGEVVATGAFDATVRLWDAGAGTPGPTLAPPHDARFMFALAFEPGGERFMLATDKDIRVLDARGGGELSRLAGHRGNVLTLAASPDGKLLASGGDDGTLIVWDGGKRLHTLTGPERVRALAFSPDSRTLAAAGYDTEVTLWDVTTGGVKDKGPSGHSGPVLALAYSPDGRTLASADLNGVIILRGAGGAAGGRTLEQRHGAAVNSLSFSPDGGTLVSAGDDKRVILWRVSDGGVLQELTHHEAEVNAAAFSPGGGLLATASRDGTAALLESAGGAGPAR